MNQTSGDNATIPTYYKFYVSEVNIILKQDIVG